MFKNKSVSTHSFAMIPRADIPRSSFRMQKALKTSFDAGYLIPMFCEEILPGDTFNVRMTAFCRLATPTFPVMDNLHMETFFFFVPNRLVWDNWQRFMGERMPNTDSSIDFLIPQTPSAADGFAVGSVADYFGLPTVGQVGAGNIINANALPIRAYYLIFNEWFRDENLQNMIDVPRGDGPDQWSPFPLVVRGKRHDYFTSALPWPQKGEAVSLPLGDRAPVSGLGWIRTALPDPNAGQGVFDTAEGAVNYPWSVNTTTTPNIGPIAMRVTEGNRSTSLPDVYADLSDATASTINQLRQAFQIQKLLERDARGGTRYTEIVRSHFGVISPDARLQRPEYLGGGRSLVQVNPVAQTSETVDTPQGNLAAYGTALAQGHGFTQSFVEHGYVIGLVNVRADLAYQQGMRRHWSRRTRYDYYFPVFAQLGEQAILSKEIYCDGSSADDDVFGYQERWAEYRYNPSEITGLMRSTTTGTVDAWHYAARFETRPVLNGNFIADTAKEVVERTTAVGDDADGQQFLMDAFFDIKAARPMPMYSVPGLIDHF